jgi:hypothetical protein
MENKISKAIQQSNGGLVNIQPFLFVGGRMSYLRYWCLFAYSVGVKQQSLNPKN